MGAGVRTGVCVPVELVVLVFAIPAAGSSMSSDLDVPEGVEEPVRAGEYRGDMESLETSVGDTAMFFSLPTTASEIARKPVRRFLRKTVLIEEGGLPSEFLSRDDVSLSIGLGDAATASMLWVAPYSSFVTVGG